jgi:hypothetical protein
MTDNTKRPLLPTGRGMAGIATAFDNVFRCVNEGTISLADAQEYVALLKARQDMVDARDLEDRLTALEGDAP